MLSKNGFWYGFISNNGPQIVDLSNEKIILPRRNKQDSEQIANQGNVCQDKKTNN